MPLLRRKYHYGLVYLSPRVEFETRTLCGQNVNVLSKHDDKDVRPVHFLGFKPYVEKLHNCEIVDLTGYATETCITGPWADLDKSIGYKGYECEKGVYLLIDGHTPVATTRRLRIDDTVRQPATVHSLFGHKKGE